MRKMTSLLALTASLAATAAAPAGDRRASPRIQRVSALQVPPGQRSFTFLQVPPAPAYGTYDPAPGSPRLRPVPEYSLYPPSPHHGGHLPPMTGPAMGPGPALGAPPLVFGDGHCPCELFDCVEYEDRDNIHPCAVKQVIAIRDPRPSCDPCGPDGCVYVMICAPPDCPKVKVKDKGHKIELDYGDYEVELESKKGKVFVDYDD